jgi:hypothetical protein
MKQEVKEKLVYLPVDISALFHFSKCNKDSLIWFLEPFSVSRKAF